MYPYAQTNLQLYNQLKRESYSSDDLNFVRDAYELATVLFAGRFQPSGKTFVAHVVGTASILASLKLPAPIVAAGLLHNVFNAGDFGDGRKGVSAARRGQITALLGPEVAEYTARFATLYWESPIMQIARNNPNALSSIDRHVLLIELSDHLEHFLDLDILYYSAPMRRSYLSNGAVGAEIAEKLGYDGLAETLRETIRQNESAELAVGTTQPLKHAAFVLVPRSCRKRAALVWSQRCATLPNSLRKTSLNVMNRLYAKSPDLLKNVYRAQKRSALLLRIKNWRTPVPPCLQEKSEEFRSLFPANAKLERVATGFEFTEGPVWIEEQRSLFFSDIPANRIFKLAALRVTVFREPSGNSNGLTRDKKGRLIACEQAHRRVTRTREDGSIEILADQFEGKKLNRPNDVVVKSDGAIYFSDPAYGLKSEEQEQPVEGVYRLSPDGTELTLVAGDFSRPNGLAFSPDEKKLYVDDSERRHIRVFDVQNGGALAGGAVFQDMNVTAAGAPDGMKADNEGRVYCTGAGGVWVFDPAGNHLGTIVTPEKPSNCAWGDDDWRSLYITAVTSVYRIRVNTPGIKIP
jgi:gluconolactonase